MVEGTRIETYFHLWLAVRSWIGMERRRLKTSNASNFEHEVPEWLAFNITQLRS